MHRALPEAMRVARSASLIPGSKRRTATPPRNSSTEDHTPVAMPARAAAPRAVVSEHPRALHRHAKQVRLELHEEIVRGCTPRRREAPVLEWLESITCAQQVRGFRVGNSTRLAARPWVRPGVPRR
jgi:hypothetical protein